MVCQFGASSIHCVVFMYPYYSCWNVNIDKRGRRRSSLLLQELLLTHMCNMSEACKECLLDRPCVRRAASSRPTYRLRIAIRPSGARGPQLKIPTICQKNSEREKNDTFLLILAPFTAMLEIVTKPKYQFAAA